MLPEPHARIAATARHLQALAPCFPRLEAAAAARPDHTGLDWPEVLQRERAFYEEQMLPYWQALAPAYARALAMPFAADAHALETAVEDWPATFDAQQDHLRQLLCASKLRQPLDERAQDPRDANRPLAEIPLYQGWMRIACQQLVCMPQAQWQSLHEPSSHYAPGQIDAHTVKRLATRIAQVFNNPPLSQENLQAQAPQSADAVVWNCSPIGLTVATNAHGMRDRLQDEDGKPKHDQGETILMPAWRYAGLCGRIRVLLEDGTPWTVMVLAPSHFVKHLMVYHLESE